MRRALLIVLLLATTSCFHRRHPIERWSPRDEEPKTLAELITRLSDDCAEHRSARIGLCEHAGTELVWLERRGVIYRNAWAFDAKTGNIAYVEERSWSDVAICLPDILDRYGSKPACEPVFVDACSSIEPLKARYGK